ncbi:MAG: BirA family biotin operon repressor/biotin-[acetyl-CoA-carboxylase] ligase [Lentisphaeria bacterium]|jgi:BirA family biotin operon repressor/biotin-[acetyl-CoA-carboxylase] ligase
MSQCKRYTAVNINSSSLSLLRCLADGCFHSGESLGHTLGVSRAAIWKILQGFSSLGVEVERQKGRGYRIVGGLSLLDEKEIRAYIGNPLVDELGSIVIAPVIDSTNRYLLDNLQGADGSGRGSACLAEMQEAGRGRRGRVWVSPFARNIYMSVSWQFEQGIAALEGLSLAVGVAIVQSLAGLGFSGVQLKWPNDILVDNKKLGGVLLEIAGDVSGQCYVVVGVGINVDMPGDLQEVISQPWLDLARLACVSGVKLPSRSHLAGALLAEMLQVLRTYESLGFEHYRSRWQELSAHAGQTVALITASKEVRGVMMGVSSSGALRLEVDGVERQFVGGEISLRYSQKS